MEVLHGKFMWGIITKIKFSWILLNLPQLKLYQFGGGVWPQLGKDAWTKDQWILILYSVFPVSVKKKLFMVLSEKLTLFTWVDYPVQWVIFFPLWPENITLFYKICIFPYPVHTDQLWKKYPLSSLFFFLASVSSYQAASISIKLSVPHFSYEQRSTLAQAVWASKLSFQILLLLNSSSLASEKFMRFIQFLMKRIFSWRLLRFSVSL